MTEQKPNSWPKFFWVFFVLSLLISSTVLICLGWYGLTGSGISADFPTWLPGVAAGLTLICAIINISSTSPSTYEILILDLIQQVIWIAATVNMAFYIAGNDAFGSCAKASALLKSSCTVSQLVLWAGVALINISLAKLAIAFCVRRQTLRKPSQQPDCEKLHIVPLSY